MIRYTIIRGYKFLICPAHDSNNHSAIYISMLKPWQHQWKFEIINIKFGINFKIYTGVAEVY